MKNTTPNAIHSLFALACIAAPVAACATDSPTNPTNPAGGSGSGSGYGSGGAAGLDPTGNWSLTYSFDAGCGQAPSQAASTFTVTLGSQGYAVAIAGTDTAGTLTCAADSCKLSAVFAWMDATGTQFQQNANITLDAQDNLKGNGTESVISSTMTCNITFTVEGTKE